MKNSIIALIAPVLLASLALPSLGAQSVGNDLKMASESAPFREVADAFIAAAIAGNTDKVVSMLSPNLVARIGSDAVKNAMTRQIMPFFASGNEIGKSVTVAGTTDASGNSGFAYYMWLIPRQGEKRPFTVYVVSEAGTRVVANIVPDRLVEGRHQ